MGFPSFITQAPTTPKDHPTAIAPNRSQRTLCWAARNEFFACLDKHNVLDPLKDPSAARTFCGPQDASFEKECKGSWVEYFKKRRVMERKREDMLKRLQEEGASNIGSS